MKPISIVPARTRGQAGAGMLTVVAVLGCILALVQGTVYYKSKGSAKFLNSEKSKVLALQLAEAGVEDNIADLGRRKIKIRPGMHDTVTYYGKAFGNGTYTTSLSTVSSGAAADTVDLVSTGSVGRGSQTVRARMKLNKVMDTTRTPLVIVTPETTLTLTNRTVPDSSYVPKVQDPEAMPALNTTAAYAACQAGSKKCDVCHLPGGDVTKANVINISKSAVNTHISHHGDYVSTDGTCDIYKPQPFLVITYRVVTDTARTITDKTTYDTTVAIDTMVRVQILTWR